MKTLRTILCQLVFVYSTSCGLLPSFSVKEGTLRLNDTLTKNSSSGIFVVFQDHTTPTAQLTPITNFAIVDQLIVPRAAVANFSDILPYQKNKATVSSNMSVEAIKVTTSTPFAAEGEEEYDKRAQDKIVVPKEEAIKNSTLEVTVVTSFSSVGTNLNASIESAIVVPKTAIASNNNYINNNSSTSNGSEVQSMNTSPTVGLDTVEPNEAGLGPISVHKRSVNSSSEEYPDTSSALFEKYDKWTGPGAITSQEILELKKKGLWVEQTTRPTKQQNQTKQRKRRRRKRETAGEGDTNVWYDYNPPLEQGETESTEDQAAEEETSYEEVLKSAYTSVESNSHENVTAVTDSNAANNTSGTTMVENMGNTNQQHLKDDVVDDDDSVCAVNKDDEEATRLVTIFWRSVFCVIFVIIVVYPIYSYTKIYCLKRKKYAESISNDRFVGSDSESSNTTNDFPIPTTATPTPTAK